MWMRGEVGEEWELKCVDSDGRFVGCKDVYMELMSVWDDEAR